jgi:hypothetical protein
LKYFHFLIVSHNAISVISCAESFINREIQVFAVKQFVMEQCLSMMNGHFVKLKVFRCGRKHFNQMSIHHHFDEMFEMCKDVHQMEEQMIQRAERIGERFGGKGETLK